MVAAANRVAAVLAVLAFSPSVSTGAPAESSRETVCLMPLSSYNRLPAARQALFRDSFFETLGFVLYGHSSREMPDSVRANNAWVDCVQATRNSERWHALLQEESRGHPESPVIRVLWDKVAPTVCKGTVPKGGTTERTLVIHTVKDWASWSRAQRLLYLGGYLDTALRMEDRLRDAGETNRYSSLVTMLERRGVGGVLEEVENLAPKGPETPLPWFLAPGLGAALARESSHP